LGKLAEAAKMKEVLEKRRRILGEKHPDTVTAMNNLARTLEDLGQLDETAKMQKDVLEKRRRILGEDHPDTIGSMNNLANTSYRSRAIQTTHRLSVRHQKLKAYSQTILLWCHRNHLHINPTML
jgi:Tetratricopeptide repeat